MGKKDDKTKSNGVEDVSLLADIRAFASELGFNTASDDQAFADFAPSKATKKIAKEPKSKSKDVEKPSKKPESKPESKEKAKPATDGPRRPAPKQPAKEQPKPSSFGHGLFSEGNRPTATGNSILKRDEISPWWDALAALPPLPTNHTRITPEVLQAKLEEAQQLLINEEAAFDTQVSRGGRGGDLRWLEQARRGGTTTDKVAAMSVMVQEAPIAGLRNLDGLLVMADKRGGARGVVGPATDALKELFLNHLLPENRKLKFFEQQNVGAAIADGNSNKDIQKRLLYWAFEDGLKKRFSRFIESLETATKDNLEFIKDRAVKTVYELLSKTPEQEQKLLSTLVNKLGDPDRKLASKAGYLLTKLLSEHSAMKLVVVKEIETFMFRPNLNTRARYYCIVYLNQMVLSHREDQGGAALAKKLIDIYFTLFKMVLDGKVGTAHDLAKASTEKKQRHAKERADKKGRKKAKAVEETTAQHAGEMDARMLSAIITGVRRAFPFVDGDDVEPLIEAHADSLFRLIHTRSLGVSTQALLLLFQLMTTRNSVSDRFYRALYSVLIHPELPRSTKAPMFLSLLFKALKADVSTKRIAAFLKRLLQVAQEAPPGLACGCLFLTSEMLKARPGLWHSIQQPEDKADDAVERFEDIAAAGEEEERPPSGRKTRSKSAKAAVSVEPKESSDDEDYQPAAQNNMTTADDWPSSKDGYDMKAREPQFSNADRSCFWEITMLVNHVHPSVAAMARTLVAGTPISYDGDPLRDFTLASFLDKFIQKKPKAATRGDSYMQPLSLTATIGGDDQPSLERLAVIEAQDVKPDELFFHKYYSLSNVQAAQQAKKLKKKAGDDDEELLSDVDIDDSDDGDDIAMDDFLAAEEDGGDEGIGADPDRGMEYDYDDLAAAMDESDPSDGGLSDSDGDDGSDSDDSDDGDKGPFKRQQDSSSSDDDDQNDDSSLDGADFSDLSDEEDQDAHPDFVSAKSHLSDQDALSSDGDDDDSDDDSDVAALLEGEEGLSSSSDDDAEGGSEDEDDELLDLDSLDDLSESEEEEASDSDDDREVAELMKQLQKKNKKRKAHDSDSEQDDVNPFDLAEGSLSSDEEAVVETKNKSKKKRKKDSDSVFASADDYEDMILKDNQGFEEDDDGDEQLATTRAPKRKANSSSRKRR